MLVTAVPEELRTLTVAPGMSAPVVTGPAPIVLAVRTDHAAVESGDSFLVARWVHDGEDADLRAVFGFGLLENRAKLLAVQTICLHEIDQENFALVVLRVVLLGRGVRQGEAGRASVGELTGSEQAYRGEHEQKGKAHGSLDFSRRRAT